MVTVEQARTRKMATKWSDSGLISLMYNLSNKTGTTAGSFFLIPKGKWQVIKIISSHLFPHIQSHSACTEIQMTDSHYYLIYVYHDTHVFFVQNLFYSHFKKLTLYDSLIVCFYEVLRPIIEVTCIFGGLRSYERTFPILEPSSNIPNFLLRQCSCLIYLINQINFPQVCPLDTEYTAK